MFPDCECGCPEVEHVCDDFHSEVSVWRPCFKCKCQQYRPKSTVL